MTARRKRSPAAAGWVSRIVDEGDVAPQVLTANPKNWRQHPPEQRAALTAALDAVGWVQRIIVNRRSGLVVDGHLRLEMALDRGETTVPVSYVELSDDEEALVLATYDPIAALATASSSSLASLLDSIQANGVGDLLDTIRRVQGLVAPPTPDFVPTDGSDQGTLDQRAKVTCPACGHVF